MYRLTYHNGLYVLVNTKDSSIVDVFRDNPETFDAASLVVAELTTPECIHYLN